MDNSRVGGRHMNETQLEIARLIVGALSLDIEPHKIGARAPLFGEDGLGLDSIDALELALAINQAYGLEIKSDDDAAVAAFASLDALANFVDRHRMPIAAVA